MLVRSVTSRSNNKLMRYRLIRFSFPTLFLILLLTNTSASAGEVTGLLAKMTTADEQLNYQGVFVLRKSDTLITMRVEHGVDERGTWESLESLNGEARKVVKVNEEVVSIYPERKLLMVTRSKNKASLHPTLPENLEKLESHYAINRLNDDRIAEHKTAVIDVRPKDNFRYGYRYWLDDNTGVLLKCDLLNEDGNVVEQMMFTEMVYLSETPAAAFAEIDLEGYVSKRMDHGRVSDASTNWHVKQLPTGFMLTQSSVRTDEATESVHLVYSDGLASVSVFVEQGENGYHYLDGASSMGALNAFGVRIGEHFVTVMGEVPAMTVMQIAQSTEYVND